MGEPVFFSRNKKTGSPIPPPKKKTELGRTIIQKSNVIFHIYKSSQVFSNETDLGKSQFFTLHT